MTQKEIYAVLEQALMLTQKGAPVKHSFGPSLYLVGKQGIFDSLDTMLFLDSVDDLLTKHTGKPVTLVTDDVFTREDTPFRSMESLAAYIAEVVPQ